MASATTAVTGATGGAGPGTPGSAAPAASRRFLLDRSTPGRLRLLLGILVLLSLAWGVLAAFTVNQYSSAASGVVAVREPLSLDAQQIYRDLSDANDTAATAFLAGGLEPPASRQRYLADIQGAGTLIENATARGGATLGGASKDLATLSTDLPVYTGEVETARADNRQGFPLGAAYLREASDLMRRTLLPVADDMYAAENASLSATSAQATGLPLVIVTLVAGLGILIVLARVSRWLRRRTHRVLNSGLLIAAAAAVISLAWLAFAYAGARGDLLTAQSRGSAPVEALARADIAALQAHADESITLIDNGGDNGAYQTLYLQQQKALGPGTGTLLTLAQTAATGSQASGGATAAVRDAQSWYAAHAQLRKLDDQDADHAGAVGSALGSGPHDAGTLFTALSADFAAGIAAGQASFAASASAGADAFTGLEAGVIAAALIMAVCCAWGLSRRLAEYR